MKRREIKLSEWATREGVPLRTAQRMASRGTLPVPFRVTDTNRIMVFVDAEEFPSALSRQEMVEMLYALQQQLSDIEEKLDSVLSS